LSAPEREVTSPSDFKVVGALRVCTSGSILKQLWRNFWQIINGHLLKSVKRMKRCANGNKNMTDPFGYENFSLNVWMARISRNKWCLQNL
jgi:hypothetical protein